MRRISHLDCGPEMSGQTVWHHRDDCYLRGWAGCVKVWCGSPGGGRQCHEEGIVVIEMEWVE